MVKLGKMRSPLNIHSNGDFRWLTFPVLESFPFLDHGFTLKPFAAQTFRRRDLLQQLRSRAGLTAERLALTDQVHSSTVAEADTERTYPRSDGLLTSHPGIALGAYSADCLLIYLLDPIRKAVGLLHAGRRGTQSRIAENAARLLLSRFGSDPSSCLAVFSPAIGPCCYEMDLEEENTRQLRSLGLTNIIPCRTCTGCQPELFYSYRKGERGNRMMGWIGIKQVRSQKAEVRSESKKQEVAAGVSSESLTASVKLSLHTPYDSHGLRLSHPGPLNL